MTRDAENPRQNVAIMSTSSAKPTTSSDGKSRREQIDKARMISSLTVSTSSHDSIENETAQLEPDINDQYRHDSRFVSLTVRLMTVSNSDACAEQLHDR